MENKKPLIIVPPMSEPLSKLKEILEGIATEENIEIFTVEDAKEFSQLLGSGGQALVMMSNAKLCATLLQDNKSLISKNHTKVILLTPKEIPIKTLEKFRKVGLTESILESTAPKTLLYKVKLQLKSIKLAVKEDTSQQVIKTMADSGPKMKLVDDDISITESRTTDENNASSEENIKKIQKGEDENTLDYLGNLKGKKTKSSEDQIETHWKSKRDNKNQEENNEEDIYSKPKIETDEDLDMYYRGKLKKNEQVEVDAEDLYQKNKATFEEEEEDFDLKKEKQIEEESAIESKKKSKIVQEEVENDFYDKKEKRDESVQEEEKRKKALVAESEEEDFIEKKEKRLEDEEEKKKRNKIEAEDLGGHLKGKINNEITEEAEEDYQDKKEIIEDVQIDNEKKKKDRLEEEEEYTEEKKQNLINDEIDEEINEGKVDHIDSFMRGDSESTAAIKTRMESESSKKKDELESEDSDDLGDKKNKQNIEESSDEDEKAIRLDEVEASDFNKRPEKLIEEEEKENTKREKLINAQAEKELTSKKNDQLTDENEDFRNKKESLDKLESDLNAKRLDTRNKEEEKGNSRSNSTNLDIENANETNHHAARVDKISTYYKSGESTKKDQDWDIPIEKKATVLDIEKAKQKENFLASTKKRSDEEVTIDYKKLKEEFEQISKEGASFSNGDSVSSSRRNGKDYSSEDHFKVVEIGPHAFDFAIEILNLIYQNDVKANLILKQIAEKLLNDESALLFTHQYKLSEKKYTETFNALNELSSSIAQDIKDNSEELTKLKNNQEMFHNFSMPIWMCRSIPDKEDFWKDYDLPSWAKNELKDKTVELIYPFFDGVDRMGYAYILFPKGINPQNEKKIIITIEMLRSVFLDTIQRSKQVENKVEEKSDQTNVEPNKVLGFFGNIFGKKKAS